MKRFLISLLILTGVGYILYLIAKALFPYEVKELREILIGPSSKD
ncbi:MAG: hypothetical protein ACUVXI_19360 [bacterium]